MSWYRRNRKRYSRFLPYVPVAERKQQAAVAVAKLQKNGQVMQPIMLVGRTISNTFWGKAWCKHLESYSDYENRLPRGRSYVRNGSVIDLKVAAGEINALVSGASIYKVSITIAPVIADKWHSIVQECAGKIGSLIELLQGKFSKAVMEVMTHPAKGLFPHPQEIKLNCSCPDWADMCKHVAAVLYGVGARLDERPEELFLLRQADHVELIVKASQASIAQATVDVSDQVLADSDLSSLFGIEMGDMSQKNADANTVQTIKNKKIKTARIIKAKKKASHVKIQIKHTNKNKRVKK